MPFLLQEKVCLTRQVAGTSRTDFLLLFIFFLCFSLFFFVFLCLSLSFFAFLCFSLLFFVFFVLSLLFFVFPYFPRILFLILENEKAKLRLPFLLQKKVFLTRQAAGIHGKNFFLKEKRWGTNPFFLWKKVQFALATLWGENGEFWYIFYRGLWLSLKVSGSHIC